MITRIWHGSTSRANASAYQSLLLNEIFPGMASRNLTGYRGISLTKRSYLRLHQRPRDMLAQLPREPGAAP